jgi:thioesterase domain-containing protein
LLHASRDDLVRQCSSLIANLSVYEVGGDHRTMLEPPEVTNLAAVLAEVTDKAFAPAEGG